MEEEKLDMNLFSEEPQIDLSGGKSLDDLFGGDNTEREGGLESDQLEDNQEEINTNEENEDSLESVVGNTENTEENIDQEEGAEDTSSNPNLFNSLTALLSERGLISSVDSDINTEEDFIDIFKKEIEKSEYADLNDTQREYLEALRQGVPQQKIEKDQYELNQLNNITEEAIKNDLDLRKRIIFQDYMNKGFSEEKAQKLLKRSLELDMDLEDSQEALESIKEYSKGRISAENQEYIKQQDKLKQQEEQRINSIKKMISTTDEVIPNIQITSSIKEKVQKTMFDVVGTDPNTKQNENALMKYRRENQEDFDYKLYYLFTITNGFKNFDSVLRNTKSRALRDLEQAVNSNTRITNPGSPTYLQDPQSYAVDIAGHDIVVD